MDLNDYEIKGTTKCDCGHDFTLKDYQELKRIDIPGFYGNRAGHYSPSKCPKCNKETLLILQQAGQTWKVIDIARQKETEKQTEVDSIEETTIENNELTEPIDGFICQECGQVCKSKSGLIAHMRKHND